MLAPPDTDTSSQLHPVRFQDDGEKTICLRLTRGGGGRFKRPTPTFSVGGSESGVGSTREISNLSLQRISHLCQNAHFQKLRVPSTRCCGGAPTMT